MKKASCTLRRSLLIKTSESEQLTLSNPDRGTRNGQDRDYDPEENQQAAGCGIATLLQAIIATFEFTFAQEAIVVTLQQMRFHLAHNIEHYAYENQQTRATEKLQDRRCFINVHHPTQTGGEHKHDGKENRTSKSQAGHCEVEKLTGWFTRTHTWNVAAIALEVFGNL